MTEITVCHTRLEGVSHFVKIKMSQIQCYLAQAHAISGTGPRVGLEQSCDSTPILYQSAGRPQISEVKGRARGGRIERGESGAAAKLAKIGEIWLKIGERVDWTPIVSLSDAVCYRRCRCSLLPQYAIAYSAGILSSERGRP